jgi:hypothetical protein
MNVACGRRPLLLTWQKYPEMNQLYRHVVAIAEAGKAGYGESLL